MHNVSFHYVFALSCLVVANFFGVLSSDSMCCAVFWYDMMAVMASSRANIDFERATTYRLYLFYGLMAAVRLSDTTTTQCNIA